MPNSLLHKIPLVTTGLFLWLLPSQVQIPAHAISPPPATPQYDATIAGQSYTTVPAATLVEQIRRAGRNTVLKYDHVVIQGRLFAPAVAIDTVRATIAFANVLFMDEISFNKVVFLNPIQVAQTVFQNGASFLAARFNSKVDLRSNRFHKHTNFKQATFLDGVDFAGCQFSGVTSFIEADFGGEEVSFSRTQFQEAAYFERARFAGQASFQDASFENIASYKEVAWQSSVSFAGARFAESAYFWQARFKDTSSFDTAWFNAEVSFNKAIFSQVVSFRQVVFLQAAKFNHAYFQNEAFFVRSRFKKEADFTGTTFASTAHLNAYFGGLLNLQHTSAPLVDFRPFPGDTQHTSSDSSVSPQAQVYLQDAHYEQSLVRWSQLAGRLAAQDSTTLADLVPVYASLRYHFRAQGLGSDADSCWVEWQERRRQTLAWTDEEWYFLQIFRLTSRYGTDLWQLGKFAGACILVFALLYRALRSPIRSLQNGPSPSLLDCVYFSFFIFTHLGATPWHLVGKARGLVILEVLLGWISWGLFIATTVHLLLR